MNIRAENRSEGSYDILTDIYIDIHEKYLQGKIVVRQGSVRYFSFVYLIWYQIWHRKTENPEKGAEEPGFVYKTT